MKHSHLRLLATITICVSVITGAAMAGKPVTIDDIAVDHWHDTDDGLLVTLRDGYSWTARCTYGDWFFAGPVEQADVDARLATVTICNPVPLRDVEGR